MCGIVGFWDARADVGAACLQAITQDMAQTLTHRGPDSGGTWVDPEAGLALGHRRLAIVDLSPEGHQPMLSADGRYVLSFNGEIYNFLDLKQQLEALGHKFRGRSDTEVMLASICQWGVQESVTRFTGMFAFALWDRQERALQLGRDRFGEKPLYYGWQGTTLLFGSELKALRRHPAWQGQINRDAIALLLRHNYINAPYCIYQNCYKLLPRTLLRFSDPRQRPEPQPYWSLREVVQQGTRQPFAGHAPEAIARLDELLRTAVRQQMLADVPLGAFLSGGIDSSAIVALMQAQSAMPVKTFSIGFYESEYNEASHAKAIAQHLGTEHTELYVTPAEAMSVIPKLATFYDEPFSDSSQIPTCLVAQLARQHVTVSLSGDGGDELFGGYPRYFIADRVAQPLNQVSARWRRCLATALQTPSPQTWERSLAPWRPFLPARLRQRQVGEKIHRFAAAIAVATPQELYRSMVSHWQEPASIVLGACEPPTALNQAAKGDNPSGTFRERPAHFLEQLMYLDTLTYLPGDILTKVDRAAMSVGLETRIPFLNHHLVEFAWQLPLSWKAPQESQSKWILRQILAQYVPPSLFERPKMGFGVPLDRWLRDELRDWAEDLLRASRLRSDGFFQVEPIRQRWAEHLSGTHNWQYHLWDILMFQAWFTEQTIAE